jgi:hypothetical protein
LPDGDARADSGPADAREVGEVVATIERGLSFAVADVERLALLVKDVRDSYARLLTALRGRP